MKPAVAIDVSVGPWSLDAETLELIRSVEAVCPAAGCHVALTGGVLYKPGNRKDLDLLFYRIRQAEKIDYEKLFLLLSALGIKTTAHYGWVTKADWYGRPMDLFFPEDTDAPNESGYS